MTKKLITNVTNRIHEIEGFMVRVLPINGGPLDARRVEDYPFRRAARSGWSIKRWREIRFDPLYPDFSVEVLGADGSPVHGGTLLETLRAAYEQDDVPVAPDPENTSGPEAIAPRRRRTSSSATPTANGSIRTIVKSIQDIMRQDVGVDGDAQRLFQLCWMFFLKILDDQDIQMEFISKGYTSPVPAELQWRAWASDPEGITGDGLLDFIDTKLFPTLRGLPLTGPEAHRARVVRGVMEDADNYMKKGTLLRQVINKINEIDFNILTDKQHFGDVYEQLLNDLQNAGNAGEYYTPRAVTTFMTMMIDPKPGELILDPACGTGGFLTSAMGHMRERYIKTPKGEATMQASLRAVEKKPLPHMLCTTNMLLHNIEDPSFVVHDNTLARPYISWGQADRVDVVLTNPPFGGKEEPGIESNFPREFQTRETADLFLALIMRLLKPTGRAAVVLPDGSLFGEGVKTHLKEKLLEECNLHTIVRLPNSVFRPYASIGTNLLFFEKGRPTEEIWFYEHRVPEGQKAYSMTKPIRVEHLQACVHWWGGASREGRVETSVAWRVPAAEVKQRGYNLDIKNPHVVADDHGDPRELLAELDAAEAKIDKVRGALIEILREAFAG